jgi:hypothetical protein
MPIHCAAMQGRVDAIETLLKHDQRGLVSEALLNEGMTPASLPHLALVNDFLDCAVWYDLSISVSRSDHF